MRNASFVSSRLVGLVSVGLVVASTACLASSKDTSGPTACPADEHEPNDTMETARELPELQDDPNSGGSVTATVHTGGEDDWFRVRVKDTGLGGDPVISATVSSSVFSITTWFVCEGARTGTSECQLGSAAERREGAEGCRGEAFEPAKDAQGSTVLDTGSGATSTTDCSGTSDDNGTLYIHVYRSSTFSEACSYDLSVKVE